VFTPLKFKLLNFTTPAKQRRTWSRLSPRLRCSGV